MADDFVDAGLCSGSWWNAARAEAAGMPASASCSSAITDAGGGGSSSTGVAFSWLPTAADAAADVDERASSGFGLPPNQSIHWNQPLLRSSFHGILQEPLRYDHQIHISPQEINQQQLLLGPQQPGFPVMLQGPLEPEPKAYHQHSSSLMMGNYQASSNDSFANFTQLLNSTPPSSGSITNHLQFSNSAPFWNPSAAAAVPVQFVTQSSSLTTKSHADSATKKSSSSSGGEASLKRQRVETPSPLPALKVRKEKLGDRITALQQLVSPFGKTDTASVLHEAIDYIKFLHDQVNMLSSPYLKNGNPMQQQQENSEMSTDGEGTKKDLRSRGLCLVPMESIYPVASETMADFWTPTFGGTYR